MIWEFDNSNTCLIGSIHALKTGQNPYSNQIDYLYTNSNHLVFETDLDGIPQYLFTYSDNKRLSDNISRKLFTKVQQRWEKFKFPDVELEKTKPWQVANKFVMKYLEKRGFLFSQGIDCSLLRRAKSDNKKITFLETADVSILCFDNMLPDEQEVYLSEVVENPDAGIIYFNKFFNAWRESDIESLSFILQELLKKYPYLYQPLVIERNNLWDNVKYLSHI